MTLFQNIPEVSSSLETLITLPSPSPGPLVPEVKGRPIQNREILIFKVNSFGEVNFGWILSKLGVHVPNSVFY